MRYLSALLICLSLAATAALSDEAIDAYNAGDYSKAFPLLYDRAMNGDATAQCLICYMYDMGLGVDENDGAAVNWYRRSAVQGNYTAQHNLGLCYEHGIGEERDYSKAISWYQKAVDQAQALGLI